jgi:putative ABC transport system permease protein
MGLSIGMACSILIFLFIFDELSYDRYHENSDNIYRVGINANFGGGDIQAYISGMPLGEAFVNEIPEVTSSVRVVKMSFESNESVIKHENKTFMERNLFYTDSTFITIFDVEFIEGDPNRCLHLPYQIIITESISKKYFGKENPVGKSLNISGQEYLISGLIKDCPPNSHFNYTVLISLVSTEYVNYSTWLANDMSYTYLLLDNKASIDKVVKKMNDMAIMQAEKELETSFGIDLKSFYESGNYFTYILQNLTDIHLHSHTDFEIEANSNIDYIYIFSVIALFILIVACINFMNLSTARSAKRAKEVGIRKVVGARKSIIFKQFLVESIVISFISLFIAMIIVETVLPFYNNSISKELSVGYSNNIYVIPALLLLAVIVGLFSGIYSASKLSSIKILNVIKGSFFSNKNNSWFRNGLVIFQFTVSIVLFISTFIIYSQLSFIKNKDVGFEKDDVLIINKAYYLRDEYQSFKQELEKNSIISGVTFSSTLPGKAFSGFPISVEGDNSNITYLPREILTDYDFADLFNLKMKEGRFFSKGFAADSFSIVLNESAVKEFGMKEPVVGQRIISTFDNNSTYWNIIGVVKDFNFRSLHQAVGPIVMLPNRRYAEYISVKFNGKLDGDKVELVKVIWQKFVMDSPFDYSILEDDFINMHMEEFKTGELFSLFSLLAIFIACLGLFGLISFMAEQKTKEIGIRKTMGSSVYRIVKLLLKQFSAWLLIANIIAWPLAYFLMNNWLQNFAYHTNIKWWVFPISTLITILIALFTVSFQAIRAARANPVESLRYE